MIDATHRKAHRTAASLRKRGRSPPHRPHQGRVKLEAARGLRPAWPALVLLLSEGQMSDHKGARLLFHALPPAKHLIADRGYDNDSLPHRARRPWHHALHSTAKEPQVSHAYDVTLYRQRHRIENMFARLKD